MRASASRVTLPTLGIAALFIISPTLSAHAFTNGQASSDFIGQVDFTSNRRLTSQSGLIFPVGVAFDSSGDLWVADTRNNRVLEFKPPFASGMAASLVIGQSDFTTNRASTSRRGLDVPLGIAFDRADNLWVADRFNHRVLGFKSPLSSGMNASVVIGQPDFTTASPDTSRVGLNSPSGVATDSSGDLWVADSTNSRILEFSPPFASGMAASLVIGQSNFTTSRFAISRNVLTFPLGVLFDQTGNLWAVDTSANRVLEFVPPFTNGMDASLVIGEPDFFTTGHDFTYQAGLRFPDAAAFDQFGKLWVTDAYSNRTLEFVPPFRDGMSASLVIGQPDFTTDSGATSRTGLNTPSGLAFDSFGNLWVSDTSNNRVLEYASQVSAQGVTSAIISNGFLSVNQSSNTGVTVTITGSSAARGTPVIVTSQVLSGKPPPVTPVNMTKTLFLNVWIDGVRDGDAYVCAFDRFADSSTTMRYWTGSGWMTPSHLSVSGKTICGSVPLPFQFDEPIVIGNGVLVPEFPTLWLILLTLVGGILVALAGVLKLLRRRTLSPVSQTSRVFC